MLLTEGTTYVLRGPTLESLVLSIALFVFIHFALTCYISRRAAQRIEALEKEVAFLRDKLEATSDRN
jgi:cell division protein FtsB